MSSNIQKPFQSWVWVENEFGIGFWDSPIPMPKENKKIYRWDEDSLNWIEVN